MEKLDNNDIEKIKKKEKQRIYHKLYYHQVRKIKQKVKIPIMIKTKRQGRITVEF
jgi:hypothetical protein